VLARPVYDRIGGQYREGRREEPRIAAAILAALGGAAPAVRAQAEALPFGDGTFGAAMGVLTVHHPCARPRQLCRWFQRRVLASPRCLPGSAGLAADAGASADT